MSNTHALEPWTRIKLPSTRLESDILYGTRGNSETADIMIVGESWGQEERRMRLPFMGKSGQLLEILLWEADIPLARCFFTNVLPLRPSGNDMATQFHFTKPARAAGTQQIRGLYPHREVRDGLDRLSQQIDLVQPRLIISLGNYALWALTENDFNIKTDYGRYVPTGIGDYRGSQLRTREHNIPLLPTYHPAATFKTYPWRAMIRHDLQMRAAKMVEAEVWNMHTVWDEPQTNYIIRPSYDTVITVLESLLQQQRQLLAVDIETRNGFIACLGIASSNTEAICIPLLSTDKGKKPGHWSPEEEASIWFWLRLVFDKHNIIGQNFSFDAQFIFSQAFYLVEDFDDTMVMHHCLYPGGGDPIKGTGPQGLVQKSLNHISSLYNYYHKYWKSEGKEWETSMPEEQLWTYNCRDCCATYEAGRHLIRELASAGLWRQYLFQKKQLNKMAMPMMLRGFKINTQARAQMQLELLDAIALFETKINPLVPAELLPPRKKGQAPWYRSPQQLAHLFYTELGIKPILSDRGTPTTGKKALPILVKREPILKPIIDAIGTLRSLKVFYGTFLQAELDPDNRMRSSFNISGTDTFRWSSSKNPWGRGTNLQNTPEGDEAAKHEEQIRTRGVVFPNVKQLFIPDPGYLICDADLVGADAQVVAWEAEDEELKTALRSGIKIHSVVSLEREGTDEQPHYDMYKRRIHATNYGGGVRTLHQTLLGLYGPDHTSEAIETAFQQYWFARHPGIKDWHDRVGDSLKKTHGVMNKFGNRIVYQDRLDSVFTQALAWIPQSTVALNCILGGLLLVKEFPFVELLSQVHDSLVFQIPKSKRHYLGKILEALNTISVPYEDPLTIPWSLKLSDKSWGHAEAWNKRSQ